MTAASAVLGLLLAAVPGTLGAQAAAQDPTSPAETAALARAARAALERPTDTDPWTEMRNRLRNERLRRGIAVPNAAERVAATIADSMASGLAGIRIDPVDGRTEVSIVAPGAPLRMAPPLIDRGRVRLTIDAPATPARLAARSFPRLSDGGVIGLRVTEDAGGSRITVDLRPGARYTALPAAEGLLLRVESPGHPAWSWAVAPPGAARPARIQAKPPAAVRAAPDPRAGTAAGRRAHGATALRLEPVQQPAAAGAAALAPPAGPAGPAARQVTAASPAPGGPAPAPRKAGTAQPSAGPLSTPQMLLLLALVVVPPVVTFRVLSRRRRKAEASRSRARGGASRTPPLTAALPRGTVQTDPAATRMIPPPPKPPSRPKKLRGWRPRQTEAPDGASRIWAARTLASSGEPPVDVARRLRLSRDAVMLIRRAGRGDESRAAMQR